MNVDINTKLDANEVIEFLSKAWSIGDMERAKQLLIIFSFHYFRKEDLLKDNK